MAGSPKSGGDHIPVSAVVSAGAPVKQKSLGRNSLHKRRGKVLLKSGRQKVGSGLANCKSRRPDKRLATDWPNSHEEVRLLPICIKCDADGGGNSLKDQAPDAHRCRLRILSSAVYWNGVRQR